MMDINANEKSMEGEKVASTADATTGTVNASGEPLSSDSHIKNAFAVTTNQTEPSTTHSMGLKAG